MKITELKDGEGYPLTNKQFYDLEERCERLWVKDEDIPAFEKACYSAMVRFIPVKDCLKEKKTKGITDYFTRHILDRDLFKLGQCFEREKALAKKEA